MPGLAGEGPDMCAEKKPDPLENSAYEAVIGLEVHVQLNTSTKMFCRCENRFGADPNTNVCPVCLGLPGALPYANRQAIEQSLRAVLACGCEVGEFTKFDRKNYFYPDLPKGYQISQFDQPLGLGGRVDFLLDGEPAGVQLTRIHLEEDAGKNTHVAGRPVSFVDLNRAGTPLLEIVTEPDISSAAEAGAFVRNLRLIMLYLGVSDCNMEEGSLRCDVNISIRPKGAEQLETRSEVKNLNSFNFIEKALNYEIARQIELKERGEEVVQETRLYDPDRDETRSMRGKEAEHDYRYFPEPDLTPITFTADHIEEIRSGLPELPIQRLERYTGELGLEPYPAELLVRDHEAAAFFDSCVEVYPQARSVANWVLNALKEEANSRKTGISSLGLDPGRFADLVKAVDDGVVSSQKARDVLEPLLESDKPVAEIISELGLEQISDDSMLREQVEKVLAEHPGPDEDVRAGKKNSVNFLVGQVMKETRGKANPGKVAEIIGELLSG
ncbi:MAG: Asp-tRNA(Asn)/Glu-tRNA(Gln) amidotransferase subunit GatB [Planctomycetota bacterium]|nr:Asp-tRNA(Asn)/Glu-tRNA(Gln) amidotransferase subunit GatB [Planctomycetota bacterium]